MKVGIVTWEKLDNRKPNSCGSSRIRGRWVWENWDDCEEYMIGESYDALIFQKAYWPDMIDNFHGVKIFDTCDPDWLERDNVFDFYDKCDVVTTSTQALADYISKMLPDKKVVHIPDRVSLEEHKPIKKKHGKDIEKVVWFGYSGNFQYITSAVKVLRKKGIEVVMYADTGVAMDGVSWKKYNYETLHKELIKYDAAIFNDNRGGIDLRGKYKSNNKQTTCWALGLPVISTPEDLKRLESKEAREEEAKEKLQLVKDKYDVKQSAQQYAKIIDEIQN